MEKIKTPALARRLRQKGAERRAKWRSASCSTAPRQSVTQPRHANCGAFNGGAIDLLNRLIKRANGSRTYDGFGRQLTETRADGTVATVDYAQCVGCITGAAYSVGTTNTVVATGASVSPPSRTYYDILGRPLLARQTGFGGSEVYQETIYDGLGRVANATMNYYASDSLIRWTQNSYDDLGRPTVSVAPDHGQTSYTYNGRTVSSVNPKGQKQTQQQNSQGQTVSIINADGSADTSTVTYTYDPFSNLATTKDSLGNVVTMSYDLLGRKTGLADPDMGNWTYSYDNLGQLLSQIDAKSQTTSFNYDLLGRMTQRSEADLLSNWYYEANQAGVVC